MGRIRSSADLGNINDLDGLRRFISIFLNDTLTQVNGNLLFGDNIKTQILSITFPTANTEVVTVHSLGKVPNGYIKVGSEAAAVIYDGTTENTSSNIYLRSTVATTVQVMVF